MASQLAKTTNADVPCTSITFRYYAGWTTKIVGQTIPVAGNYFNYTRHEAVGVVGADHPLEFPLPSGRMEIRRSPCTPDVRSF